MKPEDELAWQMAHELAAGGIGEPTKDMTPYLQSKNGALWRGTHRFGTWCVECYSWIGGPWFRQCDYPMTRSEAWDKVLEFADRAIRNKPCDQSALTS